MPTYRGEVILADDLFTLPFGGIELDRASHLRKEPDKLAGLWYSSSGRVLLVHRQSQLSLFGEGEPGWQPSASFGPYEHDSTIFLGRDGKGRVLFARAVSDEERDDSGYVNLRDVALDLDPIDQSAAAVAVALVTWHDRSKYCSRCGTPTRFSDAGHVRFCPVCPRDIFPRSDAAVIMLVSDGDFCVLGRRLGSATNRWSTLAGFVEAGESPEAAVWREVYEEVGLRIDALRYRGSQPWPFPSSLMLAYQAHAPFNDLTKNEEHHEVRWFSRSEVVENIASGALAVPSRLSAGGHLISAWIDEPLGA